MAPMTATDGAVLRSDARRDLRSPVIVGYALLFLMVFAPTSYTRLKALLLILTLAGLGLRFSRTERLGVHPTVLTRTLLFSAAGLFFVLVGSLRGNPGATAMAGVFVVWPLVYTALIGGLHDHVRLVRVVQVLVVATFAIEVSLYGFLLYRAGWLPDALYRYLDLDLGQSVASDFREFTSYSVASLLFLVPFVIGALLIWPNSVELPVRRGWLWLVGVTALPLVLLSARRGLWVAVGISPLLAMVFRIWERRGGLSGLVPWRRLLGRAIPLGAVSLLVVQATTGVGLSQVWRTFQTGFDFSTGDSGLGRNLQFHALIRGWSESPLIGKGLGAVAGDYIRSVDQPWAYELAYVALLFATGVVGVAIYAYGLVWILRRTRDMIRHRAPDAPVVLSILVGTTGMLVANGTNPYLAKFDGLWTLFLPIAFINHWLLTRHRPV
jgi:hypothetical protein